MEIDENRLSGNGGIERIILFHLTKSPVYGTYIDSLGSEYLKDDGFEEDEYEVNSYDNILFKPIYSAVQNSLNHEGFNLFKFGEIRFMNDITFQNYYSVNIFRLDFIFNLMGLNNIRYIGKYKKDGYYCSIRWNSSYVNIKKLFGSFYKDVNNHTHVFPVTDANHNFKPVKFTFIAKYSNQYIDNINLKPVIYKLYAINQMTNEKFKVHLAVGKLFKQLDSIVGFNQISQIVRNVDLLVKRYYFPVAHNIALLSAGIPSKFSKMLTESNLIAEYHFIQNKIANNDVIAGEYYL